MHMMSGDLFLKRVVSLGAGWLACCVVGPFIGFNIYFNAFKKQFSMSDINGEYLKDTQLYNI